jgi:hypothetical protein
MGENAKGLEPSHMLLLVLIYTILGPFGVTPAAIGIVAIYLARSTPILDFVINEYEAYHGKRERQQFEHLKSEVTEKIRRDVSAQYKTEHAGLKAQVGMLTEELRILRGDPTTKTTTFAEYNASVKELRRSQGLLQGEIKLLKAKIEALETAAKQQSAEKLAHVPAGTSAVPLDKSFGVSKPLSPIKSVGLFPVSAPKKAPEPPIKSVDFFQVSAPKKDPEPSIEEPLHIELPPGLKHLDPTGFGFTCIGRALGTHGGSCGSYSDEFLPKRKLAQAGATLAIMKSSTPGSTFELHALRDLADKMLCKHHGRNCGYDQVDGIARKWYDALAPAREQVRQREQKVFTPMKSLLGSAGTPGTLGSRPVSPAFSDSGSVSTAATTPDTSDGQSVRAGAEKRPFVFGAGHTVNFGSPSPPSRATSAI